MRVIIAGSRQIDTDQELVWLVADAVVKSGFKITEVVSGAARGIDLAGECWAKAMTPPIPIKQFPADWAKHGKPAGYIRNAQMVDYADALIAITKGSKGTAITIDLARRKGIPTFIYRPSP